MQQQAMPKYLVASPWYHETSYVRQKSDFTQAALEKSAISTATCVLDVGCGAGQTLRVIEEINPSATLLGLEPDETALATGRALSERIYFLKAEAEELPLADKVASHVICRVAINYMNQDRAFREMIRVLAPGGKLILSFIGSGYALKQVVHPERPGLRQRLGNLKDLLAGMLLHAWGFQGQRGTFWGRTVPYTSCWRLRRLVRHLNCQLTWLDAEGKFLGLSTIWWAIIRKTG